MLQRMQNVTNEGRAEGDGAPFFASLSGGEGLLCGTWGCGRHPQAFSAANRFLVQLLDVMVLFAAAATERGHSPDVRGHSPEVRGTSPKVKGHTAGVRSHSREVKGHSPEVRGHSPEVRVVYLTRRMLQDTH